MHGWGTCSCEERLSSPLLHLLHKHNIYWALRWEVWGLLWTVQGARKVRFAMPDWAWWKVKVVSQQTMDFDGLPRRCQTPQARAWRLHGSHGTRLGLFNGFRGCFKGTLDRSTVGWLEEADSRQGTTNMECGVISGWCTGKLLRQFPLKIVVFEWIYSTYAMSWCSRDLDLLYIIVAFSAFSHKHPTYSPFFFLQISTNGPTAAPWWRYRACHLPMRS